MECAPKRVDTVDVNLKQPKYVFMKPSEDYFAFMVSRTEGSSELNSLVGLVNYYCKFIPNMSTLMHPLNRLLSSNVHWA